MEGHDDRLHDRALAAARRAVGEGDQLANGTELRTLTLNGRQVVTWRRDGDTCVLSGTGVTAAELQKLAAWKVPADSH